MRCCPPIGRAEIDALQARRRSLVDRAIAVDATKLSARDQLTHAIFVERLGAEADLDVCNYERWAISPRRSTIGELDNIGDFHLLQLPEDAAAYRARVEAMPAAVDAYGAELAAGAADGEVAGRQSVRGLVDRVHGWADRPASTWPMVVAIGNGTLDSDVRDRLISDVTGVVARQLAPAYRRFAATLETEVLPVARDVEGLAGLVAGADCYAAEIRRHTTLPMTAAEQHELGLAETARVEAAMLVLGHELYGADTLVAIRARLDADASLHFTSEQAILTWVEGTIERARTRVAPLFAAFPAAPLEVTPYPPELGPIAASYRASPDGVQPARFFLVTQPASFISRWDPERSPVHQAPA